MGRRGRRRSRGWWAVFLSASLAMAAYIAFDVLDLEGSGPFGSLSTTVPTEERTDSETESFVSHLPRFLEPQNLVSSPLPPQSVAKVLQSLPHLLLVTSTTPLVHLRPRARVAREALGTPSAPTEPA